jgi:hypothetical protein
MKTLLNKFSLQSANFSSEVVVFLLIVWLIVIGCTVTSIYAQPFTERQRRFWIGIVALVPIVGLLAYLPFSFRREDLPQLFLMKRGRNKREGESVKRLS